MKFNQSDLIKFGLAGAAGYFGSQYLMPHFMGYARHAPSVTPQKCIPDGDPNATCRVSGIKCTHVGCQDVWNCQADCHWGNDYVLCMTQNCNNSGGGVEYRPGTAGRDLAEGIQKGESNISQGLQNAGKSVGDFLHGAGTNLLIIGGVVVVGVLALMTLKNPKI